MTFTNARCEICRAYIFQIDQVRAFRLCLSPDSLRVIDLDGQQPWSGIRAICLPCIDFVANLNPKETT